MMMITRALRSTLALMIVAGVVGVESWRSSKTDTPSLSHAPILSVNDVCERELQEMYPLAIVTDSTVEWNETAELWIAKGTFVNIGRERTFLCWVDGSLCCRRLEIDGFQR